MLGNSVKTTWIICKGALQTFCKEISTGSVHRGQMDEPEVNFLSI